ncbi:MAG: winged helix-turn-helix domain-containing protein [Steroidobacteraceae bacterium]
MVRFGNYRVDRAGHELFLGDELIALQPKAFDLLLFLIDQRDRLVPKEELLGALWPGVIVTEGSLQRVVSLLRQALRPGGCEDYIRTYHRLGYRFVGDVRSLEPAVTDAEQGAAESLAAARDAMRRSQWDEAVAQFLHADRCGTRLDVADLLDWASSAQCSGRLAAAVEPLERALRQQAVEGRRDAAAKTTVELARVQAERGQSVAAEGWLKHAERLVQDSGDCEATGQVAWLKARFCVASGQYAAALEFAEAAERIGRQCNSADLIALGLIYQGHASLATGQVQQGVAKFDEAATLVLGDNVQPIAGGLVYCGVLFASTNRGDWTRAIQWNESFDQWCRRSKVNVFPGICRMHHAEILAVRGDLQDAERALLESADELGVAAAYLEGEAYRILGDIQRLRGDCAEAERSYRYAQELGWEPQPGYAELLLDRGEPERAVRSLEMTLMNDAWPVQQRRATLLAVLARCAARAGDTGKAQSRLQEFDALEAEGLSTPALLALRAEAAAETALALDRVEEAVLQMKKALNFWTSVAAPSITARLRARLVAMLDVMEAGGGKPGPEQAG